MSEPPNTSASALYVHFETHVRSNFHDFANEPNSEKYAHNAAYAVAHFSDWAFWYFLRHDLNKLGGAEREDKFRKYIIANHCPDLAIVSDIADSAKHRFLTRNPSRVSTSSTGTFLDRADTLIVSNDGRRFIDILRGVFNFWESYVLKSSGGASLADNTIDGDIPAVFTTQTLAKRWKCSDQHIRDIIKKGQLPAFRVGRMIRIPAHFVEKFERGN